MAAIDHSIISFVPGSSDAGSGDGDDVKLSFAASK
jgi:hypothetical protein